MQSDLGFWSTKQQRFVIAGLLSIAQQPPSPWPRQRKR